MTIVKNESKVEIEDFGRTTKTPCLILNRIEGVKYKSLDYAKVNSDVIQAETHIKVCPSFPNRRASVVLESMHFFNQKVERIVVEFYEFLPTGGWKFKKQYTERVLE